MRLNDLLAEGYSVVNITSDTNTIHIALEKPTVSKTIRLTRDDALRMLGAEREEVHPLLM